MNDENEKLNLDDLEKSSEDNDSGIQVEASDDLGSVAGELFDGNEDNAVDRLEAVYNVPVQVSAVLGKATMPISQLIKLGRGAILELDRKVGESVDIVINNRLVARGEVVVVDERIGITMTEIIKNEN